jgi:hypothetical protein
LGAIGELINHQAAGRYEASGSQVRREANAVSTRGARRVNVILSGR